MSNPELIRRKPLHSLTGLRFFAALSVFCFHITLFAGPIPPNSAINPFADQGLASGLEWFFSKAGYLGVSFFFVLSGFVLTWSAIDGEPMRAFWRRRVLKIFPNHLVMTAVAAVLFAAAYTSWTTWGGNVLLLHALSPDPTVHVSGNPPSWTLCVEFLFYMLFPLILKPIRRIPENRLWFWAGALVAGMVLVQVANLTLINDPTPSPIEPSLSVTQVWFGYFFPLPRLLECVLGMVLARVVMAGRAPRIGLLPAGLSVAVGYGASLVVPYVFSFVVATIIPVALVILAWTTADLEGRRTGLSGPRAVWFGNVSFGFYLCQGVAVAYGRMLLPDGPFDIVTGIGVAALLFVVNLLMGWALYALVERPVMRRWARPRKKTAVEPTTTAVPTT
ncbi:MAG: acyltransferase [Saccharothrix sp.]|nr:acyltransferase [Saccharothrix sp.]